MYKMNENANVESKRIEGFLNPLALLLPHHWPQTALSLHLLSSLPPNGRRERKTIGQSTIDPDTSCLPLVPDNGNVSLVSRYLPTDSLLDVSPRASMWTVQIGGEGKRGDGDLDTGRAI